MRLDLHEDYAGELAEIGDGLERAVLAELRLSKARGDGYRSPEDFQSQALRDYHRRALQAGRRRLRAMRRDANEVLGL